MSNETMWGVVEMMGHRQIAGRFSEVTRFGATFLQVEIPQPDGTFMVQLVGGSAIYDLHYTSEAKAREIAPRSLVLADKALMPPRPPAYEDEVEYDDFDEDDDEHGPECHCETCLQDHPERIEDDEDDMHFADGEDDDEHGPECHCETCLQDHPERIEDDEDDMHFADGEDIPVPEAPAPIEAEG